MKLLIAGINLSERLPRVITACQCSAFIGGPGRKGYGVDIPALVCVTEWGRTNNGRISDTSRLEQIPLIQSVVIGLSLINTTVRQSLLGFILRKANDYSHIWSALFDRAVRKLRWSTSKTGYQLGDYLLKKRTKRGKNQIKVRPMSWLVLMIRNGWCSLGGETCTNWRVKLES